MSLLLAILIIADILLFALVVLLRYWAAVRRHDRRPTVSAVPLPPAGGRDDKTAAGQWSWSGASRASRAYWTQGLPRRHRFRLFRRHHHRAA